MKKPSFEYSLSNCFQTSTANFDILSPEITEWGTLGDGSRRAEKEASPAVLFNYISIVLLLFFGSTTGGNLFLKCYYYLIVLHKS